MSLARTIDSYSSARCTFRRPLRDRLLFFAQCAFVFIQGTGALQHVVAPFHPVPVVAWSVDMSSTQWVLGLPATGANQSCLLTFAQQRKWIRDQDVVRVYLPPADLYGRVAALRIHGSGFFDLCLINMYAPP